MKRLLALVLLVAGTSCVAGRSLPYDDWRLGFLAPSNMEVWVETADVEDVNGRLFTRAGSGTVAISYDADPNWPKRPGRGAGRYVYGAVLPKRVYVRWQSLVEPQTYRVTLEIPERARELMLEHHANADCRMKYRNALVVGLAPGGIAKVWVRGTCVPPVEVMCVQAEVVPEGPHEGKVTYGKKAQYWSLDDKAKHYVEQHGIPYDSWKCDKPLPAAR